MLSPLEPCGKWHRRILELSEYLPWDWLRRDGIQGPLADYMQ
jgi:hypothetical protein